MENVVLSLMDCSFRRFEHTLRAYERNTGRPHPYALNRTHHSNEPRAFIPVPLTSHSNVLWTADIAVGTPAKSFTGQSLFWVAQTSKLITKCQNV